MALSLDQQLALERLFEFCDMNRDKLSAWEESFINDHMARYEEHGADMRISPKQQAILDRIENKLCI